MVDLYKEVIPSILQYKKNVLLDEIDEKDYNSYMVNRTLSYHIDCVGYVNEMNMNWQVDKKMQYDFYLHGIRSMKRPFQKWQKKLVTKEVIGIKEYFKCSESKSLEIMKILSQDQINDIMKLIDKGGTKK